MHELPITQSIVKIACEEAEKHNAKKVYEIRIKVGELSGLVPECIQYYYDIVSEGTIAKGAKIIVDKVQMKMHCNECSYEDEFSNVEGSSCPRCGSNSVKVLGGNEFYIESMEVENDGD